MCSSDLIVPGLGLACVKVPFCDPPSARKRSQEGPAVEQMWVNEVSFDGKLVKGVLINSPHWLKSVKEGDDVEVPISGISDWMYSVIRSSLRGLYRELPSPKNESRRAESS